MSLLRAPRFRRCGAWLATFALIVHALLMTAHQPAFSAATPFPFDPHALCLTSGVVPDDAGAPGQPGDHGSDQAGSPCPICQRLGTLHSYLPTLVAILIPPSERPNPLAVDATAAQPPRLALTTLNPRGPPALA